MIKTELERVLPGDIEKRSFEIITEELGNRVLDPDVAYLQLLQSIPDRQ